MDPYGQWSDEEIWKVAEEVKLFSVICIPLEEGSNDCHMLYLLWNLRKKNAEECYAINHVSLLPNKKARLSETIIKKKKGNFYTAQCGFLMQ